MQLRRNDFVSDEKVNVWCPPAGLKNFDYKDGAESELLQKISACSARSIYSEQLTPYRDWLEGQI